jgi:hypothetical protein
MVFVPPKDRVLEHSTSNSQTVFALSGAVDASMNAFSASMSVGDITIGGVVEPGVAFKSGKLTYSAANQITIDSTGFESKGTFSSGGTKEVFMGLPAKSALMVDGAQSLSSPQQLQARQNIAAIGTGDALGSAQVATQANQESASSTTLAVTPGRQQYHPSAAKAWGSVNFGGTVLSGYNLSSVTDTSTGDETFNWTTPFSSGAYTAVATITATPAGSAASTFATQISNSTAPSAVRVFTLRLSDFGGADGNSVACVAFGDQ